MPTHAKSASPRRKPAKRWIKGTAREMQRWVGRIDEIKEGCYCLSLWRPTDRRPESVMWLNLVKRTAGMSVVGKLRAGDEIELWTWKQNKKPYDRIHLKKA